MLFCSAVGASQLKDTRSIRDHLDALIIAAGHPADDNDAENALAYIRRHQAKITAEPDIAIRAMIVARQSNNLELALNLGVDALDKNAGEHHARLIYEVAYTLLLFGDCKRARPLFQVLAHQDYPAPAWIKSESQKGLLLCPRDHEWSVKTSVEVSHDSNLAGITPQQNITPEAGSVLANILNLFDGHIDLPDQVVLGNTPQSGYWLTIKPTIWRHWRRHQTLVTARIIPSIRLTNPRGYEHVNITGQLARHQILGRVIGVNQLEIYRHDRKHGPNTGKTTDTGWTLFSGAEWQFRYPLLIGGIVADGKSQSAGIAIKTNSYGFRAGLRSVQHDSNPIHWSVTAQMLTRDADQLAYADDLRSLSASIGDFAIGPFVQVKVDGSYQHQRPRFPRPWLEKRHNRFDRVIAITSRHTIGSRDFDIILRHHNTASGDPLETGENVSIMIRFNQGL